MPPFRPGPGFRRGAGGGGSRVSRLRGTTTTHASSKREHIQRKLDRARTREENGTWRYGTPVSGAEAQLARGTLYESTSRAELLRRVDTKARRYMNDLPADFMWGMIDGSDEVKATKLFCG